MLGPGVASAEVRQSYPFAARLTSDHKNFDDEENLEQIIILVGRACVRLLVVQIWRVLVYAPTAAH